LKEQELVNLHLIESDLCYNLKLGGDGGTTQNQEVRKTFSLTRRGKFTKQDNHFYGKKHSNETKKKMSDLAKTRTGSLNSNYKGGPKPNKFSSEKERQLAQSEFMKKANPMHSEEIRKKHSESMKNKPRITCPHCAKNMDMGGYAVHKTALLRKGIVI
jgi:hypothetical protein